MGWTVVSGLVLLTGAIGWLRFRELVGYVTFALTVLLIMLPWWAHAVSARAIQALTVSARLPLCELRRAATSLRRLA